MPGVDKVCVVFCFQPNIDVKNNRSLTFTGTQTTKAFHSLTECGMVLLFPEYQGSVDKTGLNSFDQSFTSYLEDAHDKVCVRAHVVEILLQPVLKAGNLDYTSDLFNKDPHILMIL